MTDLITLHELALHTHIGVTEEERKVGQQVSVTVVFPVDASIPGRSDALKDTVDYAAVADVVRGLAAGERATVERLAEDIAAAVLKAFALPTVTITVKKYPFRDAKGASLTITRPFR